MKIRLASRIQNLRPYLFADLDAKKNEALARGVDVISLTIGDPDLPTPEPIVAAAQAALAEPINHGYPDYPGSPAFRQAAASWMAKRFGVELDAEAQVLALIGSKEGIAHLPFALLDSGDVALCPEPGYPVYAIATELAGASAHLLPLRPEHSFLPDLDAIDADVLARAKLLWLNYPNNPTGATADINFLRKAVAFARQHKLLLAMDHAYSEIGFDGYQAPSVLQVEGAAELAVEFHSFSKTYNMAGWRIGFVAGNRQVVGALAKMKSNMDSGVFRVVQQAGIAALESWPQTLGSLLSTYQQRRDILVPGLRALGYQPPNPQATFYVWMPVPGGDDLAFCARLIEEVGVLVTPGSGFGPSGRGFVRFTLCLPQARLREALDRLAKAGIGA